MSAPSDQSLQVLRARGVVEPVETAMLLGFGLGGVAEGMSGGITVPYAELPGFPVIDEPGQGARLTIGRLEGVNVCCLQGQAHFYDSGDPACMSDALALVKALGAKQLLIFAAAGSVRQDLYPGTVALISDHINLTGLNPLIGRIDQHAFFSLNEAYDQRMQRRLKRAATLSGVATHEGVYMWLAGPTFATPAESRMARTLGADLVGMSIVPETILARRLGMRVTAVAVVTNFGAGFQNGNPTHNETMQQAKAGSIALRRLIRSVLKTWDQHGA
jgi:purine-nucleoside phosphorylase